MKKFSIEIEEVLQKVVEVEAANKNEGCYTSSIAQCCKGIRKTSGGFEWMYEEDYEKMLEDITTS